ncbi:MAG: glycosyltransferase [Bifidobacterium criceti]|nr:glycosyltransferase [Bifidobacterium criceti]
MSSFTFANILLESNPRSENYPGLYCRADKAVSLNPQDGFWMLTGAGTFDFTTYFNSLSVMKLLRYTTAKGFRLHIELRGAACTVVQTVTDQFSKEPAPVPETSKRLEESDRWTGVDIDFQVDAGTVLAGFIIETEGAVEVRNGRYEFDLEDDPNDVELVLATTTFKKESFVAANIDLVRQGIVESDEDVSKHFHMYVMDNGRTLDKAALDSDRITIVPEGNVGGAGGFTRGMIIALEQEPPATHVILMDDDVSVSPESIKRTYNLLRILKPEHAYSMISGAMLNYRIGEEQCEDLGYMGPRGEFQPCKPPLRMSILDDIIYNEMFEPTEDMHRALYAGWWYCCIPTAMIRENGLPLPVFVRSDDTEYGWRCHPEFITMNSLCVWHMPFQEKYDAAVERYQTTRNPLISQFTTGFAPGSDFIYAMFNKLRLELKKFGYANAELVLDGFEDFLKGPRFIGQKGVAERTFLAANTHKEKLMTFEELQRAVDKDPALQGFDIRKIDRQFIEEDYERTYPQRLVDYVTDNGQRYLKTSGEGYAVIPLMGWVYPAGAIRGKQKLIVLDWYARKGAIRTKDVERYHAIRKRYLRDMRYYRTHAKRLHAEYAAARGRFTSIEFWKDYLDMK